MRRHVFLFRDGAAPKRLMVERSDGTIAASLEDRTESLDVALLPDGRRSVLFADGRQVCGRAVARAGGVVEILRPGRRRRIHLADPLTDRMASSSGALAAGAGEQEIRALMPGRVVSVAVSPGERVPAGGLLLVLEAMKMQNEIRSDHPAVVSRVEVAAGAAIEAGTLMVGLKPEARSA